jgi:hypothetical protein
LSNVPFVTAPPFTSIARDHFQLCKEAFDKARKTSISVNEVRKAIAYFHYVWGTCMPLHRGSAAVGEWMANALYKIKGLDQPKLSMHAHIDQLIQSSFTFEEFFDEYQKLF